MHDGEFSVGKRMLRDYINATVGFESLSKAVGSPSKSLMRMLGETGNPHADRLFGILGHLKDADRLEVRGVPKAGKPSGPPRQPIWLSMNAASCALLTAPTWVAIGLPSLNSIRVGMLRVVLARRLRVLVDVHPWRCSACRRTRRPTRRGWARSSGEGRTTRPSSPPGPGWRTPRTSDAKLWSLTFLMAGSWAFRDVNRDSANLLFRSAAKSALEFTIRISEQ